MKTTEFWNLIDRLLNENKITQDEYKVIAGFVTSLYKRIDEIEQYYDDVYGELDIL